MRLLVISHTAHHQRNGGVVGWGATVREIDALAEDFEEVVHVAFLYQGPPPESALPYRSRRVRLVPVPPSGGGRWRDKLGILWRLPVYAFIIRRELAKADAVHVRSPANIALLAIQMLTFARRPSRRWLKYAGSWVGYPGEPWSYRFQRWWLRAGLHRGLVTVNGDWPGMPPHVRSFLNPCLSEEELAEAHRRTASKTLKVPLQLLFVGRLDTEKGASRALRVCTLSRMASASRDRSALCGCAHHAAS